MNETETLPIPSDPATEETFAEDEDMRTEESCEIPPDDLFDELEDPFEEPLDEHEEFLMERRPPRFSLFGVFSGILSAITVFILSVTLIAALSRVEIQKNDITRYLLGEFAGGIQNVYLAKKTETSPPPPPTHSDTLEGVEKIPLPEDLSEDESLSGTSSILLSRDMSSTAKDSLGLVNETPYTPDLHTLLQAKRTIPYIDSLYSTYGEGAPVVLILHTHGTEAFADQFADGFRSSDPSKNIISVGAVLAEKLNEAGIVTIHSTELLDSPDFNLAYYNAAQLIRAALEKYPSISYVLDIHRDAIESGGIYYNPTTYVGSTPTAQLMFVVGTDHGGSGHVSWRNNLGLAVRLQADISGRFPSVMRDIHLRSASFNEQYTSGSLLIEVGSCASSLKEAKAAASLLADALIREIRGY